MYLEKLEAALKGDVASAHDYEWIILEMYDQTVREESGGEMLTYLRHDPLPNEAFVYARIGEEGRSLVRALRRQPAARLAQLDSPRRFHVHVKRQRQRLFALLDRVRNRLLALWLGRDGLRALRIGRFRLTGEVHQWMYDRYSLAQLMLAAGFQDPIEQAATQSRIPHWPSFNLDTLPDGIINKPDSLFMEAIKPVET
ncbi:MAG: methyltransferase type 11 [bacterium]|nr:methyltransferase type 11 [bacterium]